MTITKKIMSLAMVVALSLNGCADLDVGNTNAPDQARALASPEDVESVSYTHLTLPTTPYV